MEPILDMGYWTAFLSLYLLEAFSALQITGPSDVISLSGATTDGAAVLVPNMKSMTNGNFPISRWSLSTWVHILSGTSDDARFLQLTGYTGNSVVDCYVTWPTNGVPTFTFGATDHMVAGNVVLSNRHESAWFFIYMGSADGTSFGYVNFRSDTNNLYSVSWTELVSATRETSIKAPANANPFNVSST